MREAAAMREKEAAEERYQGAIRVAEELAQRSLQEAEAVKRAIRELTRRSEERERSYQELAEALQQMQADLAETAGPTRRSLLRPCKRRRVASTGSARIEQPHAEGYPTEGQQ